MQRYKVRDVIREQVGGGDSLSEGTLAWCEEKALREIEKAGNWYWMNSVRVFDTVVNQQDYVLYPTGLLIPNYKAPRILMTRDPTITDPQWLEVFGPQDVGDLKLAGKDSDTDIPGAWSITEENSSATLSVWPPLPDKTYNMRLYYYQWTSLPADLTSESHEVLKRWPEALIYLATAEGVLLKTKDIQAAAFWRSRFDDPANPRLDNEMRKIQQYHALRSQASQITPRQAGNLQPAWHRSGGTWM